MKPHLIPMIPLSLSFTTGCAPRGPLEGVWAYEPGPEPTGYDPYEVERDDGCVVRLERRLAFDGEQRVFFLDLLTARCEEGESESYASGVGAFDTYAVLGDGLYTVPTRSGSQSSCMRTDDQLQCEPSGFQPLTLRFRALTSRRGNPPWSQ